MMTTRNIAMLVLLALTLSISSSLAAEFASSCDDCCGETACEDCALCWCCSAIPAVVVVDSSVEIHRKTIDIIEVPRHQFIESLSYELLDPPPRS